MRRAAPRQVSDLPPAPPSLRGEEAMRRRRYGVRTRPKDHFLRRTMYRRRVDSRVRERETDTERHRGRQVERQR